MLHVGTTPEQFLAHKSKHLFNFVRFHSQGKPDLNTSLPVRQTASIFKQPVTKVTNHPNNKVKTDPQKAVDQPRQVIPIDVNNRTDEPERQVLDAVTGSILVPDVAKMTLNMLLFYLCVTVEATDVVFFLSTAILGEET